MSSKKLARSIADAARTMRQKYPDLEGYESVGTEGGLIQCRKPHWPDGVTISVPPTQGSNLTAVGANVVLGFYKAARQMPFIKSIRGMARGGTIEVPLIISLGQWGQSWSRFYLDGIGYASKTPLQNFVDNYPGSGQISFSGLSISGTIRMALSLPGGKVGFAAYHTDINGDLDYVRFFVATPDTSNVWPVISYHDFPMTLDRDRKGGQGYVNDCYGFFDSTTNYVTIFTRMFDKIPDSSPITDKATVLTIKVENPTSPTLANIGEIQVSSASDILHKYTARCMNVAGKYMVKGAFTEQNSTATVADAYIFLYEQNLDTGVWSLTAAVNWLDYLMNNFFTPRYVDPDNLPSFPASNPWVRGIGDNPIATQNTNNRAQYGPPFAQIGNNGYWFGLAAGTAAAGGTAIQQGDYGPASGGYHGKICEIQCNVVNGSLSHVTLYDQISFTQSDCINMINQLTAQATNYPPAYAPFTFTESWSEICALDFTTYHYTRTYERLYYGVLYQSISSPWSNAKIPMDPWGNASQDPSRKIGCPAPILYQHYAASSDGKRYGAFAKPIPVVCDGPFTARQVEPGAVESVSIYLSGSDTTAGQFIINDPPSFDWYQFQQFGACSFWITKRTVGGYLPVYKFMWETVLTMVSEGNAVNLLTLPNQRHEFYPGDPVLPIPEVVWQKIPYPELGVVFWLHNWRDSKECACGAPMITVTDTDLTSVLYTIPASEFFPLTKFESDQFYTIDGNDFYWAYTGEFKHYMNGVSGKGPLMKPMRIEIGEGTYENYLILSVEYYQRVAPVTGNETFFVQTSQTFNVNDSENQEGHTFTLANEPTSIDSVKVDGDDVDYSWASGFDVYINTALLSGEELLISYTYETSAGLPASEGESWVKGIIIRVTSDSYTIEKVEIVSTTWTYPNIGMPFSTYSVEDTRLAAILGDRLLQGFAQIRT